MPVVTWWKMVAATIAFAYGTAENFLADSEEKGTALVRPIRIKARVTRHQPSLRTLYVSRSLGARFRWEGGRNPIGTVSFPGALLGNEVKIMEMGNVCLESEVRRTSNDHYRIVYAAQATQAVPECCTVRVCVEDLARLSGLLGRCNIMSSWEEKPVQ